MLTRLRTLALALLVAGNLACLPHAAGPTAPLPAGGTHVLFIGNSLTYVNDLPATVRALAALAGDTVRVAMLAHPNFALIDHVATGEAQQVLQREPWNVVVMQQGSSALDESRVLLNQGVDALVPFIRAAGAKAAMYEVWPTIDRAFDAARVRDSYRLAAQRVNGLFYPAGTAWQEAWKLDFSLPLYDPDGLHPSKLGTYLAALVMVEQLTGKDVRTLPAVAYANGAPFDLPAPTVRMLQEAAHAANARGMSK